MDEHDLERQLRRYQPAGPPARLRVRILATDTRRIWPWAAAAAALLAVTIGLHGSTADAYAALPRFGDSGGEAAGLYPALREVVSDDEAAMMQMTRPLRPPAPASEVTQWP